MFGIYVDLFFVYFLLPLVRYFVSQKPLDNFVAINPSFSEPRTEAKQGLRGMVQKSASETVKRSTAFGTKIGVLLQFSDGDMVLQ